VTAIEVCGSLVSLTRIWGNSGIELSYLVGVFHMKSRFHLRKVFRSVAANPVVCVERNRTFGKSKAHLEIDDAGGRL
jgi:hypothetical protein